MEISRIYRKFIPQLLHMLILPLFFFTFMLIYRPFDAQELIGSEWYGVHLTIVSCIILVCTVLTRLLYYFLPMKINYTLCRNDFHVLFCSPVSVARAQEAGPIFQHPCTSDGNLNLHSCHSLFHPGSVITHL